MCTVFVPSSEDRNNYACGVFIVFSQVSGNEIIVLTKNKLNPFEDIDSVSSNMQRYFSFEVLGL